jgi:hypothetical protein
LKFILFKQDSAEGLSMFNRAHCCYSRTFLACIWLLVRLQSHWLCRSSSTNWVKLNVGSSWSRRGLRSLRWVLVIWRIGSICGCRSSSLRGLTAGGTSAFAGITAPRDCLSCLKKFTSKSLIWSMLSNLTGTSGAALQLIWQSFRHMSRSMLRMLAKGWFIHRKNMSCTCRESCPSSRFKSRWSRTHQTSIWTCD